MFFVVFFYPVDLFQDLSQLQETWLTEGEFGIFLMIISIASAGNYELSGINWVKLCLFALGQRRD